MPTAWIEFMFDNISDKYVRGGVAVWYIHMVWVWYGYGMVCTVMYRGTNKKKKIYILYRYVIIIRGYRTGIENKWVVYTYIFLYFFFFFCCVLLYSMLILYYTYVTYPMAYPFSFFFFLVVALGGVPGDWSRQIIMEAMLWHFIVWYVCRQTVKR